jgi:hypothetical protein
LLAELQQHERRLRAPGHERRIAAADSLKAATGGERVGQRLPKVAGHHPKARAAVEEPLGVSSVVVALVGATREHGRGVVDLPLLDERICQVAVQVAGGETEPPRFRGLESLTALAFRLGQLAPMQKHLRPEGLGGGKGGN